MKLERCQATNKGGSSCNAQARPDRATCAWHDVDLADQRKAWSGKGGRARSNAARAKKRLPDGLMTPAELRGLLGTVLKAVVAGQLEPGVGNAAANIARAMTTIQEAQEFEERIATLEQRAGLSDGGTA